MHRKQNRNITQQPRSAAQLLLLGCALLLLMSACGKRPRTVLGNEQMAQLMADIHIAEAVVDFNYQKFPDDSSRRMLKQSILLAHNVSQEQMDTSLAWYGNNLDEYMKVYDRTIEIIQDRQKAVAEQTHANIAVAGDSVVVWEGPQRMTIGPTMPRNIITFCIYPDTTWKNGDIYNLRLKVLNAQPDINHRLLVDYTDGTTQLVSESPWDNSSKSLWLQIDSTLTPTRLYGYIAINGTDNNRYELDSISVTRLRKNLKPHFRAPTIRFRHGEHATASPTDMPLPSATDMHLPSVTDMHLPSVTELDTHPTHTTPHHQHSRQNTTISDEVREKASQRKTSEHHDAAAKQKAEGAKPKTNHRNMLQPSPQKQAPNRRQSTSQQQTPRRQQPSSQQQPPGRQQPSSQQQPPGRRQPSSQQQTPA